VAGPNGSGKSTLYEQTDIEGFSRSVWIINPDLLTLRIAQQENAAAAAANGQALDRIWAWLDASIRAYQTVGVETVPSTDEYRALVSNAKSLGFEFRLLYVCLRDADLNVERVRLRAAGTTSLRPRSAHDMRGRSHNCRGFSIKPTSRRSMTIPVPSRHWSGKR
jgi:predicted ABC-type ATPase